MLIGFSEKQTLIRVKNSKWFGRKGFIDIFRRLQRKEERHLSYFSCGKTEKWKSDCIGKFQTGV